MPFETPNIALTGSVSATVHDPAGGETTIIKAGDAWSVHIRWSMTGPGWHLVAGTWHVHVNLESIGPGPELSLFDNIDPDCRSQPLPSANGNYSCHFDVPGSVMSTVQVPHQGLAMKMVVLITYVDPLGHRGPIAAYVEGPILQFYEDHP